MDNISLIKKAGLSEAQAKAYLALIQNGKLSPTKLGNLINENRTNCYAILEKLEKYGLAEKTKDKKTSYRPTHPSNLETLAEKRRCALSQNEKIIKDNISSILDVYYAHNEAPGSHIYQGLEGIREIYDDIVRTGETQYFIRSTPDITTSGDLLRDFHKRLLEKNIETIALIPDTEVNRENQKDNTDNRMKFHRTWMPKDAFPSSTEIAIYGNKVAFINYGETQTSIIISSPAIASAMKLVFNMLQTYWQDNYPQS